jgi:hypothetical protein
MKTKILKRIAYYNAKNNRYQYGEVIKIDGDDIYCLNKPAKFEYKESLNKLIEYSKADNPNWKGETKKPLIIFKY